MARKVMLATTAYDSPDSSYTHAIARSREYLHNKGIATAYVLLAGNCHVDDARNTVVRDFLESDCEDLIFIDADVSWEPEHLAALCAFDKDIVGGVYPYRGDNGVHMPVRHLEGCFLPDEDGLLEVEGLPTGFMRIRRHVLEKIAGVSGKFYKAGDVPLIFERDILDGGRRGGDIRFCMRWRELGGKVYAAADLRLGHCGKSISRDSLSAALRRARGTSLAYVAESLRRGEDDPGLFHEAMMAAPNPWGARTDVLRLACLMARKSTGPIIEAGSGLSTVLMAACTEQTVWCIEHLPYYAIQTEWLARQAGVKNINIVTAPLKDGWYDLTEDLPHMPERYSLGLIDGPPRIAGDRMRFFDVFGDRCQAFLADDADDTAYRARLSGWAEAHGMVVRGDHGRAAVIIPQSLLEAA